MGRREERQGKDGRKEGILGEHHKAFVVSI